MLSFRISIRTRKLRNLQFKFTLWTYRLILHTKTPKNITQLNTKLGFSVTHIPTNCNLQIFSLVKNSFFN